MVLPNTPKSKKDFYGSEALNENNLICRAIKLIKKTLLTDNKIQIIKYIIKTAK